MAYQCAVSGRRYIESTEVLEYKVTDSTVLRKLCEKDGIPYFWYDREQLFRCLNQEEQRTLVVSAGNTYLIPGAVLRKKNLTVINWHNALLPQHKGRNAEAWSIYEGDTQTGITWHRIVEDVDAGDIIAQEKIGIDNTMTSLRLFQKQCEVGLKVFDEIIEAVLSDKCAFQKQPETEVRQMHYSYEIPNGGWLEPDWGFEKISRFLRAMDYGALQLLGRMKIKWQGEEYSFHKYRLEPGESDEKIVWEGNDLVICKSGQRAVLRALKKKGSNDNEK